MFAVIEPVRASAAGPAWRRSPTAGPRRRRPRLHPRQPRQHGQFRPLPLAATGPDNDLNDLFDFHLLPLIGVAAARVYAFGRAWGPEPTADKYFGFTPGRGVHDIHQNQGNVGRFTDDDGVWQDGGLLTHANGVLDGDPAALPVAGVAHRRPDGPHPLHDSGAAAAGPPGRWRANRRGSGQPARRGARGRERRAAQHQLRAGRARGLPLVTSVGSAPLSGSLGAASARSITMPASAPLSNKGGSITLLDASGRKLHGVAYSAEQASHEDRVIVF